MMTSSNGNIVRVSGHLCGEFTGPRGVLMCSLMRAWINGWVNIREAGDLRPHRAHYDVTVMKTHEFRLLGFSDYVDCVIVRYSEECSPFPSCRVLPTACRINIYKIPTIYKSYSMWGLNQWLRALWLQHSLTIRYTILYHGAGIISDLRRPEALNLLTWRVSVLPPTIIFPSRDGHSWLNYDYRLMSSEWLSEMSLGNVLQPGKN